MLDSHSSKTSAVARARRRITGMWIFSAATAVAAISLSGAAQAALTISTGKTKNVACNAGVCAPTSATAVLNVSQLESMLASSSVEVTTGSLGASVSDIDVQAGITWSSANALTLDAYNSVYIGRPVAVTGTGGVTITHDDGGTTGNFLIGPTANIHFLGLSNSLTIDGHGYTLVGDIVTLVADVSNNPSGNFALADKYNAARDGTYSNSPVPNLSGRFDGLGNIISGLTISAPNGGGVGFISSLSATAHAKHVRLHNVNINAGSGSLVGGVVAQNDGEVSGSFVSGKIIAGNSNQYGTLAGGLVGQNGSTGTILNNVVDVKISAGASSQSITGVGGLVGWNGGSITDSFAAGSVKGGTGSQVGGLVGQNNGGTIQNAYAVASVAVDKNGAAGGLIGASNPGQYTAVYSSGAVSGKAGSLLGGLIGNDFGSFDFTDAYWDMTSSGITNPDQGAGNVQNDAGITGLTTTQLQAGLPAGFSNTIWAESAKLNGGLPYLLVLPPAK
ncbi:MAG: GLUG motif-containing protein [Rhizomicrobium sp.]|jgi:hypothetical protein